ncbi:hypothetical protein [Chengkuizengella marina]|uniref:Phage portal protein n=1 Tax=Chengkuizengella marina TaxID=2507566 RepID=A0A6N9Q032_9BACL|nr:hypothetical protein [Chengkuizengella marina]NBI28607.1 hypothetical protein [Chengkuizengella marina]
MSEVVNIQKNSTGKVITAELAYTPYTSSYYDFTERFEEVKYTTKNIRKLLSNHVKNAKQLRETSDYLYSTNGIYRRLVDTIKNLASNEHVILPHIKNKEKFDEEKFKEKQSSVSNYLWNCNFEITLEDIFFKLVKYGRYSAYDRGSYIQPLPLDYTRIIGISFDGNPIIQFDFRYFDKFQNIRERNMQLNGFDSVFKSLYMDYKRKIDNPNELISDELNWRTLPSDKTYTLKIGSNLESKEGIGMLFGSIDDILFYDEIRELDRAIISSQKRKIVVQQLPVDKDGNSILGEEEINLSHNNLKKLLPPNVGCLTVLGGTKFENIPLELSGLEKGKMKEVQGDVLVSAGIGEGALKGGNFSTGVLNIDVISNTVMKIMKQIESIWLNRKFKQLTTGGQYQFKARFLGITSQNREKMIKIFDGLLDKGGSLSPSISARGFNLEEYMDILTVENNLDYKDKFEALATSFTTSAKDVGKPNGTGEGGENTEKSQSNGGNFSPRPSA